MGLFTNAQTTFNLDWFSGVPSGDVTITIDVGDSVEWTWADTLPHSVTNDAGAQETFDSGILTGSGTTFTYTFTQVGVNPYHCNVHSGMIGTITVEQGLSVEDKFAMNVNFFPNPVQNALTITSLYSLDSYQITDILGKTVMLTKVSGNVVDVNTASLNAGIYFVTVTSEGMETTFKVVKR